MFEVSSLIGEGVKVSSFPNTIPKNTASNMLSHLTGKVASLRAFYPNLFFINVILCPRRCLNNSGDTLKTETLIRKCDKAH